MEDYRVGFVDSNTFESESQVQSQSPGSNYDTVVIGEDLIDKSSGIFTCKTRGTYLFVVSGHTQNDSEIDVHLNDVNEMILRNTGSGNYGNLSFTWSLTLNPGDRVQLRIRSGTFYVQPTSSYPYRMYFSGFLLA